MTQLVYGKNVVKQILKDAGKAHKVYLAVESPEIESYCAKGHIPVEHVSKKKLNAMTGSDSHQGVAIEIDSYKTYTVQELVENVPSNRPGLFLLLDELEDPHNLGAILRTADCVQADGVIFKKNHAVGLTPTVAKVSAGAIDTVKCAAVTNLVRTAQDLKKQNWWIVGADMQGKDYRSFAYDTNIVLVIGNEGKGISRLMKETCDYLVSIPMNGKITSLNASVSAGILLYGIYNKRFPY